MKYGCMAVVAAAVLALTACSSGSASTTMSPATAPVAASATTAPAVVASQIHVTPNDELRGGQVVTVLVTGLRPDANATIAQCPSSRAGDSPNGCGRSVDGMRTTAIADAAGRASVQITINEGDNLLNGRGGRFACPSCVMQAWTNLDRSAAASAPLHFHRLTPVERPTARPAAGPLPPGIRAATARTIVGTWAPVKASPHDGYIDVESSGTWSGSDGCNGTGGAWSIGRGGSVKATSTGWTAKACDWSSANVPDWLIDATIAGFDGRTLVLFDENGSTHRLVRQA